MQNFLWGVSTSAGQIEGNIKTDVLIIGGGMCGILCAYMLKEKGVGYVLVEADKICRGITNDTTAKITLQHGLIYNITKDVERNLIKLFVGVILLKINKCLYYG
jgi:glycine/D-amino acid oxidase-like deaminating enzyme